MRDLRVSALVGQWTMGVLKSVTIDGTSRRSLFFGATEAAAFVAATIVGAYSWMPYAKNQLAQSTRGGAFWIDRHANSSADFAPFKVAAGHVRSAERADDLPIVSVVEVGLPFYGRRVSLTK
jgi:hypothetical protein